MCKLTELACILRADTDNPNVMDKRSESQEEHPTHDLMQKMFKISSWHC